MKNICIFQLCLFLFIQQSICLNGILSLNSTTLTKAKIDFPHLVVYFYSEDCQYCEAFNKVFQTVVAKNQLSTNENNLQFAKIQFNNTNKAAFEEYHVQSVPDLRIFSNGLNSLARYGSLDYQEFAVQQIEIWIDRVVNPGNFKTLPNFHLDTNNPQNCLNQKCQRVIVHCSNSQLTDILIKTSLYYQYLDVSFTCLNNDQIQLDDIYFQNIYTKKKTDQCLTKDTDEKVISPRCLNLIMNMKRFGTQHWNYQHFQQLIQQNRTIFALLVSNETTSLEYLKQFVDIKSKWDSEKDFSDNILPIFAVADKDYDLEEVLRLKKFIGGYINNGLVYPFPLLVALKLDQKGNINKYLYELRYPFFKKSQISMQMWMNNIISGKNVEKHSRNQDYKKDVTQQEKMSQMVEFLKGSIQDKRILMMNLYELHYMIDYFKNGKPKEEEANRLIFVIYICKTSHKMSQTLHLTKKWLLNQKLNHYFFFIDYFENDTPPSVSVTQLPALLVYHKGALLKKFEGVLKSTQLHKNIEDFSKQHQEKATK